ncbi:hypothetical protein AHF37_11713 [Paragonimus kellicotti]|nr:hypothetical protein AHF37_11713 [Paragonimus kellicotti]
MPCDVNSPVNRLSHDDEDTAPCIRTEHMHKMVDGSSDANTFLKFVGVVAANQPTTVLRRLK